MKATILSLCDFTGNWSRPYERAGYPVVRVDLRDGRDVRLLERLDVPVRGILAAPPCTAFSKAGAHVWATKGDAGLLEGLSIVDACLRIIWAHRPVWWALENPAGRLRQYLGPPAFSFQPCDHGDPWTKRTYLWGDFTPPAPLFAPAGNRPVLATLGDRTTHLSSRAKVERSATPEGFSAAFFEANP